ncbi:MAG: Flp pilus assembly protein CpaB [Hungatella hathewayi]|nr:Flp pilus assembly protein CpaB [Hungatella hathewayi]
MKKTKLIALLAAVIATIAIWSVLNRRTTPQFDEADYLPVVTARINISEGTVIEAGMLEVRQVLSTYVPGSAYTQTDDVIGNVARDEIAAGEMVTRGRFSTTEGGGIGLAYQMEDGRRAFTLEVGIEAGVAGLIAVGNKVDILVTDLNEQGQFTTDYLLQQVEVLAVDSRLKKFDASDIMYGSVTLSVTPEEALLTESRVYTARTVNGGNLRLTLRPQADESITEAEPVVYQGVTTTVTAPETEADVEQE